MKKLVTTIIWLLISAAGLEGCAGVVEAGQQLQLADIQRVTAIAVRENLAPDQIMPTSVQGAAACSGQCTATWHATAPTGEYDCSAVWGPGQSYGMHKTVCVKR